MRIEVRANGTVVQDGLHSESGAQV
jgi:hypothetical protein